MSPTAGQLRSPDTKRTRVNSNGKKRGTKKAAMLKQQQQEEEEEEEEEQGQQEAVAVVEAAAAEAAPNGPLAMIAQLFSPAKPGPVRRSARTLKPVAAMR